MSGIVYKIENIINKKVYIGITTKSLEIRFKQHINSIHSKRSRQCHFYLSMKKYGIANFKIEKIDSAMSLLDLYEKEQFYIRVYKSIKSEYGYNKSIGGNVSTISEEGRRRLSNCAKQRWSNPEFSNKMRQKLKGIKKIGLPWNKGKNSSKESIEKISKNRKGKYTGSKNHNFSKGPMFGKVMTEEHKNKIANQLVGNKNSKVGSEHHASRKIICIETQEVFINVSEAKRKYKTGNLYKAATTGRKSNGMHWKYVDS